MAAIMTVVALLLASLALAAATPGYGGNEHSNYREIHVPRYARPYSKQPDFHHSYDVQEDHQGFEDDRSEHNYASPSTGTPSPSGFGFGPAGLAAPGFPRNPTNADVNQALQVVLNLIRRAPPTATGPNAHDVSKALKVLVNLIQQTMPNAAAQVPAVQLLLGLSPAGTFNANQGNAGQLINLGQINPGLLNGQFGAGQLAAGPQFGAAGQFGAGQFGAGGFGAGQFGNLG